MAQESKLYKRRGWAFRFLRTSGLKWHRVEEVQNGYGTWYAVRLMTAEEIERSEREISCHKLIAKQIQIMAEHLPELYNTESELDRILCGLPEIACTTEAVPSVRRHSLPQSHE